MNNTPNPIIVDVEAVLTDLAVDTETVSNDLLVNVSSGSELRPMPHITIGEVETLPPTDDAYATMTGTYADPVLNLGLVKGDKGDQGEQGPAGALNSVSADVDANIGTPSVTVDYDGDNAAFHFHNLKGAKGDTGQQGPQGEQGIQGETGQTGATGAAAGFGTVSASVDNNIGTPSVEVTSSGADTAKNFSFAFHNLKGATGETGQTGQTGAAAGFGTVSATVDSTVGTPSVTVTTSGTDQALNLAFSFHNLKGESGDGNVVSVNGQTGVVVLDADDVGALPDNTVIHNVPSGGTTGQVLSKASGTDYDVEWSTPSGGGGDYILTYDPDCSVGLAEVGSAVTHDPNYTPSGDIRQTIEELELMTGGTAELTASFSNGTLTLGVSLTPTTATKSVATSAPVFVGNGVHFNIVGGSPSSPIVDIGQADYMQI